MRIKDPGMLPQCKTIMKMLTSQGLEDCQGLYVLGRRVSWMLLYPTLIEYWLLATPSHPCSLDECP